MRKKKASGEFMSEFFRHPKQLGTPFESSRYLARAVAKHVVGKNVIELGAGHGPVTRSILHYNPKVRLTAFEINSGLVRHLNEINDPRLRIVNDSAENFYEYVSDFDCIVSGLPLTSMPRPVVDKILLNSRRSLVYIQYKYFPEKKLLRKYFDSVRGIIVWRNVPPAIVYICKNHCPLEQYAV